MAVGMKREVEAAVEHRVAIMAARCMTSRHAYEEPLPVRSRRIVTRCCDAQNMKCWLNKTKGFIFKKKKSSVRVAWN